MKLVYKEKKYYILYVLIFTSVVLSAYNFYFLDKILPGVYLNDESFTGLTQKQAKAKMESMLPKSSKIIIKWDKNSYDISNSALNLNYNIDTTYEKLFKKGRTGYVTQFSYITGFFTPINNETYDYSLSETMLDIELATLSAQVFPKVKNAYFTIDNDVLTINEAGSGKIMNLPKLKDDIKDNVKRGKNIYNVDSTEFIPTVYEKDLEVIRPKMENLITKGLELNYKDEKYSPLPEQLLQFLNFDKLSDKVVAKINTIDVENYILDISSKINREPKSIDFKVNDKGEVSSFIPPTNGRSLNKEETKNSISSVLLKYFNESSDLNTISLKVDETTPDPNSNKYGITELVAEGISYFAHSIAARVSNIKTASDKINGTLVAPGGFYSFNESVGPIDLANGFNTAYVISKGRTILGTGGGVCQVSSTVFRAALNGGFPITERTAHAYRVGYYEQNSYVGYDATIYQPSVDLKFKNDTEHYLLVTSEVDTKNMKMWVRIYGTGDGRKVEVTVPKLGPQIAPPETIYEDDPSLPKGQVVQIEYSAWGGSSVFKQIVKNKDGSLKFENEFKSYYRPWPAVYKKGTKS